MILYGLQSVFSVWMMVDAVQRGSARYWYPVLFLPFGPFVYFFMVKIHDPEFRVFHRVFAAWTRPKVTLETLRYRATETPSLANKLALAQGLFDAALYAEAAGAFEAVRAQDGDNKDALYGLALCRLEAKNYPIAIDLLTEIIDLKPSYREYAAWPRLAYALQHAERHDDVLTLLDELVRTAPRLGHRVVYARYLRDAQRTDQARDQLERALREHEHAPRHQQRQDAAAARNARELLGQL